MPCEICGTRCSGRRCKECQMLKRQEEIDKKEHTEEQKPPICYNCKSETTNGRYSLDNPGVLLCQDCHPNPEEGRKPVSDQDY